MNAFLQRHAAPVIGVPSGFERLLFRGTPRLIATAAGLTRHPWPRRVLPEDFAGRSGSLGGQVRRESGRVAGDAGRPVPHVGHPSARKGERARPITTRGGPVGRQGMPPAGGKADAATAAAAGPRVDEAR